MENIKAFIGYIPILIILIPCLVAYVRQALYYTGCMDGFEFVLVAMFAFAVGGILNLIFLLLSTLMKKRYLHDLDDKHKKIAEAAIFSSGFTFLIQLIVVFYFILIRG